MPRPRHLKAKIVFSLSFVLLVMVKIDDTGSCLVLEYEVNSIIGVHEVEWKLQLCAVAKDSLGDMELQISLGKKGMIKILLLAKLELIICVPICHMLDCVTFSVTVSKKDANAFTLSWLVRYGFLLLGCGKQDLHVWPVFSLVTSVFQKMSVYMRFEMVPFFFFYYYCCCCCCCYHCYVFMMELYEFPVKHRGAEWSRRPSQLTRKLQKAFEL
ncbi:hypothetical protein Dimus_021229 [Dionaea muscipula]